MINTHRLNWLPYVLIVISLHILGFGLLYLANTNHLLLGMGLLAYTLGLRHAFDADHIAAIDNTVRKLIQQQRNPLGVGFYFSIGHSTVVFYGCLLGISIKWAKDALPHFQEIGEIIGTRFRNIFNSHRYIKSNDINFFNNFIFKVSQRQN